MLTGIDPLLTGELLRHLDEAGHSDGILIADAHFPAARIARRLVTLPGTTSPRVLRAIRTLIPLDDDNPLDLMTDPSGAVLDIHVELANAAGLPVGGARLLGRFEFYDVAAESFVVIRTGETATYANAMLRKGLVGV